MKLKKFLLGSALFVVVSLCSFTLAYADDGVTGSLTSGLLEQITYLDTFTSSNKTYIDARSYDFPITSMTRIWNFNSNTLAKSFSVSFDTPISSGVFYFEGYDEYVQWHAPQTVYATYQDGSYSNVTSSLVFTSTGNDISFTVDISSVYSYEHGGIIYFDFIFPSNQGTVHTELECTYANVFPVSNLYNGWLGCIPYSHFDALSSSVDTKTYSVSYDVGIQLVELLNVNRLGAPLSKLRDDGTTSSTFYNNYYLINDDYISSAYTWNRNQPAVNELLLFKNIFNQICRVYVVPDTNYGNQTVISLQELIEIMGGNGGVDDENERAQEAISEVDDALGQQEALEGAWRGSMTANFNSLAVSSYDFDSDTAYGLAFVGSVFSSLWNSMGKWSVLYSFPLLLGVVLLLIGRISRHDKKERRDQSKSNKK